MLYVIEKPFQTPNKYAEFVLDILILILWSRQQYPDSKESVLYDNTSMQYMQYQVSTYICWLYYQESACLMGNISRSACMKWHLWKQWEAWVVLLSNIPHEFFRFQAFKRHILTFIMVSSDVLSTESFQIIKCTVLHHERR